MSPDEVAVARARREELQQVREAVVARARKRAEERATADPLDDVERRGRTVSDGRALFEARQAGRRGPEPPAAA